METKEKLKKEITDSFGELLSNDNYPPIAGRILGLFYTSDQKYFTFEEIKTALNISKSATSKALSFLNQINEVAYTYDEHNKRLRLFYLNIEGLVKRISTVLEAYKLQSKLFEQVLNLRNDDNSTLNNYIEKSILFSEDVLGFVQQKLEFHFEDILKDKIIL
ncbi:hypothetical protein [uncultured Kordia sp.]|uniref:hypothetical protein n=1 Tax=uncultured Kordia sp. TaxID=507699 RepID=UPI002602EF34|nr:hypothetical protein [uncultured Kordia sp.]